MKEFVQHPVYGEIVYTESALSGKKTLEVNGVKAQQLSKKEYMVNEKRAILKGSYLAGASLCIDGEVIQLSHKPSWYETFLGALPFLFLVIWGNNAVLCSVFPVVGGALGGALGGIAMVLSLLLMKQQRSAALKVLIGISTVVITAFAAFILAISLIILASGY